MKKYFDNLIFINRGFVEGGDILNIFDHFVLEFSEQINRFKFKNILISLGLLFQYVRLLKRTSFQI